MKKNFVYAMMSAIALTGAVSFSACSTSEEDLTNSPTIEKEDIGKGVVTQFALNLSQTQGSATRTTPNAVQLDPSINTFRGMDDIWLIPMFFAQAKTDGGYTEGTYTGDNAVKVRVGGVDKTVEIYGQLTGFNYNYFEINPSWETVIYNLGAIPRGTISTAQSSKVYSLTLPVGTSNFLFYGKALKSPGTSASEILAANFEFGSLNSTLAQTNASANDIRFSLQPIVATSDISGDGKPENVLEGILNAVERTNYDDGAVTHYWRDYMSSDDNSKTTLKLAYKNYVTIGSTEVRAGSAEAIRATLQELYRTVLAQSRVGQTPEVINMANAIRTAIETYFDVYFYTQDGGIYALDWSSADVTGPVSAENVNGKTGGAYTYQYYNAFLKYKSTDAKVYNFPMEQGLPAGAARLGVTTSGSTRTFSYQNTNTGVTTGNAGDVISKITFPAELTYFDNSALRATTVNKEVKDYPITIETWDNPATANWSDWTQKYVTTETRAVAMKNNINYGVALLESQVSRGSNNTPLKDNRKAIINDGITEDQDITITDKSFIMTGILIGGQPTQVGWDFLPVANDARDMVVYDRLLSNGTNSGKYDLISYPDETYVKQTGKYYSFVTEAGTAKNYTILLDNYQAPDQANQVEDIAVAIELVNNTGQEFYGRDNVIPVGGTFYLAGKLTMTNAKTHDLIDWDTYLANQNNDYKDRFPAYGINRIFTQDHTTVAKFTFKADALKHAYNTIPDLRSIQMLFGLSVDLKWEKGLQIDVEL